MVVGSVGVERNQVITDIDSVPGVQRTKGIQRIRLAPDDYGDVGWVLEQLGVAVERRGYTLLERLRNRLRRLPDSPKITQTPSWVQDLDI